MPSRRRNLVAFAAWSLMAATSEPTVAAEPVDTTRGDRMIAAYFEGETRRLADECLSDIHSWKDWTSRRETYRQQLREMLGLDPLPERTPLQPVITGSVEHDEFTVEKLHFQSRPQLYVTANLYLPKNRKEPAPAVLYVCGHSKAIKDSVSYGNKTEYQHHGAWFARNGYVCLVIDTLQLGEIEGIHHGTYRENMWWWNARGYTPAGVEAWNSIRALDYLASRPEVDAERLGVTGRSGGGAYSWYLAALDDRIKVVVPVAGITSLKNHVVDGCVEGHCDCMYMVNTYRWDYAQVAALAAPRPLLVSNTDQDHIFPLDGVLDVHGKVESLYALSRKRGNLGLHIAYGPHDDTQVLQLHAFQWFNKHFKGDDAPIQILAEAFFEPEQLKVFDTLPADEINTRIHEKFTGLAPKPATPSSKEEWQAQTDKWKKALREKCFAGWPAEVKQADSAPQPAFEVEAGDARFLAYDFESQHNIRLRLYLLLPANVPRQKLTKVVLAPLSQNGWTNLSSSFPAEFATKLSDKTPAATNEQFDELTRGILASGQGMAFVAPRGIGPTAWNDDPMKQTHVRRRFMLLGQTLDGMRVWDVRRAIQVLRSVDGLGDVPVVLRAEGEMAGIALYAALFETRIEFVELRNLAKTHVDGPDFLNVLRILDVPQTVAMVGENAFVTIFDDEAAWEYPLAVARKFGWNRVTIEPDADVEE